jgi:predicted nucleic acid-binding protein
MLEPARFAFVLAALSDAELIEPAEINAVYRDAKDDKFFAVAVAGRADYIVGEDLGILAIAEHAGTRTVTVAAFLHALDQAL